jgi:proliferating cell nuclear antigen
MVFEAKLEQAALWKKIVEAIKDLVADVNIECQASGISLQALDTTHVSLVALKLKSSAFDPWICDRNITLGLNMSTLGKILKCAGNDDSVTLRSEDSTDNLTFLFETKGKDKLSEFQLKLINLEAETLSVADQEYSATVTMSSVEFQRICRDLSMLGDTVTIDVSKEGVRFVTSGPIGTGNILVKKNSAADKADDQVDIQLQEPIALNFGLRYLGLFSKAASLSTRVRLGMGAELPLEVEFKIEDKGYVKFFLAPKVDDEGMEQAE